MAKKDVTRLFKQFAPEHYDLSITPDADKMTFAGQVVITGQKVGRPSQRLTFHQKDLKVTVVSVVKHDKKGDQPVEIDRVNTQKSFDEVRLHSKSMLYPGTYTVTLAFSGTITRPMNGLYPCFFKQGTKEKRLLATQFESHHAREVFPCIDEPEAKATFDVTLTTPATDTVISNTPVKKRTIKGKQATTRFETTPLMSVYLLAFVTGDLAHINAKTKHGVEVRTYATPDNVKFTEFALEVAVKCLDFYNDYFGINYPLPKCDLIALPDFAAGAMENWGCITFREHALFVDPKNTSLPVKQYVAMVVAHELAHQWFGNLVTMRWWTDLWLNEGFASWIEYLAVDHIFPDWEMWTQFITDEQQAAFRADALENTHPIEVPVHHPAEIRSIFDAISYHKGSSVIHMLHQYLGADNFRDGLRHYLKQHAYKNTDTIDLWQALEDISKQPVKKFMHDWTSLPGFPLVKVNHNGRKLHISQSRFYANLADQKDDGQLWPVPLNTNLKPALLNASSHVWDESPTKGVLKINQGNTGFYRTIYDDVSLNHLATAVSNGALEPIDRLGVLSDLFEAAKAGYISVKASLDVLSHYAHETNNAVWDVIAGNLGSLRAIMDDEELRDDMKPFVRRLVAAELKRLGWEGPKDEPHFDSLLRPTILGLASVSDEPSVVKACQDRFKAMKKPDDLPADTRGVIYNTVARLGDQATFDKLLKLHNASDSAEERYQLVSALTAFKDPNVIAQALKQIDSKNVRLQDITYWIAYSFMNRHAKVATWQWFTKHWDWLKANMGSDMSFSRLPMYAAGNFNDRDFLKKYKAFFKPRLTPDLERAYKQGLETIEWHAAWKDRDLVAVKNFFRAQLDNS